jgi:S-methylmethionine-dependent homocysteine/selenocysteine methylase
MGKFSFVGSETPGSCGRERPLLLDGGLATELQRRGAAVREPWWSTRALLDTNGRALVHAIHSDYLRAGADVITANTFRTNLRALRRAGLDDEQAARLVGTAVTVARSALDDAPDAPDATGALLAASMAPVEDCYRPSLVPDDADLWREHQWMARSLAEAGVDLVLVETMNTIREAVIALRSVHTVGVVAWVSFVCSSGARLLSGEDVGTAVAAAVDAGAGAVLVNCTVPAATEAALRRVREVCRGPIGAYPNLEDRSGLPAATPVDRHLPPSVGPTAFAEIGARWRDELGLKILGGCCGTEPSHITALRRRLGGRNVSGHDR